MSMRQGKSGTEVVVLQGQKSHYINICPTAEMICSKHGDISKRGKICPPGIKAASNFPTSASPSCLF